MPEGSTVIRGFPHAQHLKRLRQTSRLRSGLCRHPLQGWSRQGHGWQREAEGCLSFGIPWALAKLSMLSRKQLEDPWSSPSFNKQMNLISQTTPTLPGSIVHRPLPFLSTCSDYSCQPSSLTMKANNKSGEYTASRSAEYWSRSPSFPKSFSLHQTVRASEKPVAGARLQDQ